MSKSYTVSLVYGVMVMGKALSTQQPNPKYGKFKYDPDTGKLVTEFLDVNIDIESIARDYGFDVEYSSEKSECFIGKSYGTACINDDIETYVRGEFPDFDFGEKLLAFRIKLRDLGISTDVPMMHAVGNWY